MNSGSPSSDSPIRFAEELLLLLFDDHQGDLSAKLAQPKLHLLLAGAVLMDLALEGRIDTDLSRLILVDPTPVGDGLLDPSLADIAQAANGRDAGFWVERLAEGPARDVRERALTRLAERGILEKEGEGGGFFLSRLVSRARCYDVRGDGTAKEEVRLRLMRVLFSHDIPDPRDVVIIGLADAAGVFDRILTRSELVEARDRIDLVKKLDLIGQAVTRAVRDAEPAAGAACRPASEIPCAPGLPIAGNAFSLTGDLVEFLLQQYRRLGPVFRIRAFRRRFTVLAGPEANRFLAHAGAHFRTHEVFFGFNAELGALHQIMSMSGAGHARVRKQQAPAYSRKALTGRVGEVVDIVRRDVAEWPENQPLPAHYICQRIIVEELGRLTAATATREYLDDVIIFVDALVSVYLTGSRSRLTMRRPGVRRARRRLLELAGRVLAEHEPERRRGRVPDFIDEIVALHHADPELLPETDLAAAALSPFIVAVETAPSVCACMLYELLSRPVLLDRVRAEADALLGRGVPALSDLRALDVTHRVAMETMRLHPIGPATPRIVANSFEFQGYKVPAGDNLLVAIAVTHRMAECFPDPERFDIDRYTDERAEHRRLGAWAPFSVGEHACLGRGLAEALIMLNVAVIVHETELALDPPGYVLKKKHLPSPHPDGSLKFRLRRRRR